MSLVHAPSSEMRFLGSGDGMVLQFVQQDILKRLWVLIYDVFTKFTNMDFRAQIQQREEN